MKNNRKESALLLSCLLGLLSVVSAEAENKPATTPVAKPAASSSEKTAAAATTRVLTAQQKELVSSVHNLQSAAKLTQQRKWPQAYAAFTNVIKANPELGIAYGNRALTLIAMKRYKEAVADCDKAISLGKDSADVYNRRAAAYMQIKDYNHALADYTKIINLQPTSAVAYRDRAVCYLRKGDKKSAMRDIAMTKKAMGGKIADTKQQEKTSFLTVGGSKIVDLSSMPVQKFAEAIKKDPAHKPIYMLHRATVYLFQGKPQPALADLDEVLKLSDDDLKKIGCPPRNKILQLRISAQHKAGRDEEAISECDKLLKQNPGDEQMLLLRSMSKFQMGKYKEAIADANGIKANAKLKYSAKIIIDKANAKLKGK